MGNECCCSEDKSGSPTLESETVGQHIIKTEPVVPVDVSYWSQSESLPSGSAATRIDPHDGHVYTFPKLFRKYNGTYSEAEINYYWQYECWPIDNYENFDDCTLTCEFVIRLEKSVASELLGIGVRKATLPNELLIKKPGSEALQQWHHMNPANIVRDGDAIIAVNGKSGDADFLVAELQASNIVDIEITLRRHTIIAVDVTLSGPLGLHLNPDTLAVNRISHGALSSRNQTCKPSLEILEGDRLIRVNELHALNGEDLSTEVSKLNKPHHDLLNPSVHLVFSRPSIE